MATLEETIISGVLDTPIARAGSRTGDTSVRAAVAFLDSNLDDLPRKIADEVLGRTLPYVDPATRKVSAARGTSLGMETSWMGANASSRRA